MSESAVAVAQPTNCRVVWKILLIQWLGCASLLGLVPAAAAFGQEAPRIAVAEDAATAPLDQPVPLEPELITGQFDNGLRYYIRENREPANRAELRLVLDVGSILEDEDQLGIAHVLEHMAFNGTENFEKQELIAFMESIGMRMGSDLNASTGYDQTNYMLRVPTDEPGHMQTAFQVMEDWATSLSFDPDEVEQERLVVIEEWRGGQNANSRVQQQQLPVILRGSRYADRQPIGGLASLENFTHEALRRFYADWYRPDLMAVIAVGDFDAVEIEGLVYEHFEHLANPENPRERIRYEVPPHEGTRVSIVTDPEIPGTTIGVAYRLDSNDIATIGDVRQRMIESLYSNMFSQRLSDRARQAAPPFVAAGGGKSESFLNSGAAFVLTALVQGDGIEGALEALVTESERAMRFGFTEAEFERVKSTILRSLERSLENRNSRPSTLFVNQYTALFLRDAPVLGLEYDVALSRRFLDEITLDEVNAVDREWISDTNRVVIVTAPQNDQMTIPDEDAVLAVLAESRVSDVEAFVDTVADRELLSVLPEGRPVVASSETSTGLTEWQLENGVRVLIKPTEFDQDVILFRAFSPGGISLAADEELVPARTATRVAGAGGLAGFNANELRQVLAGTIASATPYINEFDEGLTGSASPADLDTLFKLIYLRFTAPFADEAAFEVFEAQAELFLANRSQNPMQVFNDRFNEIMTQGHPRRQPETLEMFEAASLEQSLDFYRDRFADASDFTFVFVGSVDLDEIRPFVERYLGGLPSISREEDWRDIGVRPPRGIIEEIVYQGLEPVSQTRVAMSGPFAIEDVNERTRLQAAGMVLQNRLRDVLREQLGATYSVGAGSTSSWLPERTYGITIQFSSDPQRVDELFATILAEISKLKDDGPTDSEVSNVREALRRQYELNMERNSYWVGLIAASHQFGFDSGEDWEREYPASIDALDVASAQDAIRRFIDTENYVRVTLLPESMAPVP